VTGDVAVVFDAQRGRLFGMVHVMRYGAASADADRARLETFAPAAGISAGDVATSRFLPKMTVATALPTVGTGLAGRPPVAVEETPGLLAARAAQPVVRASLSAA
jgi:hypothetical protein